LKFGDQSDHLAANDSDIFCPVKRFLFRDNHKVWTLVRIIRYLVTVDKRLGDERETLAHDLCVNIFALFLENSLPPCFAHLEHRIADKDFVCVFDNLPFAIDLLLNGEKLFVEVIVYLDLFHD